MNQIEQREEEDPHEVDDMPVEPTEIDGGIVLRAEMPLHASQDEPADHDHSDHHVNAVKAGHRVVDGKEPMGVDRKFLVLEMRLIRVFDVPGSGSASCGAALTSSEASPAIPWELRSPRAQPELKA